MALYMGNWGYDPTYSGPITLIITSLGPTFQEIGIDGTLKGPNEPQYLLAHYHLLSANLTTNLWGTHLHTSHIF